MIRRILAIAAATALLPVFLAASASASPAATAHHATQHMPVLITGKIKFHGKPVKGATVKLYADPLPKVLHKVKVAHQIPDTLIGKTVTGPKGGYAITVTAAALKIMKARAVRGIVNLHVLAFTHKAGTVFWFPKMVSLHKLAADAPVASMATPEVANLTLPPDESTAMSPVVAGLLGIPDGTAFNFAWCGRRYLMFSVGPKRTITGATYSNMKNVQMLFTYTHGQATTLGVGFSASFLGSTEPGPGSLGLSFSQNSTVSWNSSITIPYPGHSGIRNDQYGTKFVYGDSYTLCAGYSVEPIDFAGGSSDVQVTGFPSDNAHCAYYLPTPGQAVTLNNSKATDYSAGVSISGVIGINLSAETDHDSSSALSYTFPKGGWLCGTTGDPGGKASNNTIYAGKYHHSPPKRKTAA